MPMDDIEMIQRLKKERSDQEMIFFPRINLFVIIIQIAVRFVVFISVVTRSRLDWCTSSKNSVFII